MWKIIDHLIACDYPIIMCLSRNRNNKKKEKSYIYTVGRMDCECTCAKKLLFCF